MYIRLCIYGVQWKIKVFAKALELPVAERAFRKAMPTYKCEIGAHLLKACIMLALLYSYRPRLLVTRK